MFIHKMSIFEADDCSHDEAAKLIVENTNSAENTKRKKSKERKSVRISDEEITFYPADDSGYREESTRLLEDWSDVFSENTIEEWTEEVCGNDASLKDIKHTSHDPLLRNKSENKVTFCDNPVATENSVEQCETYSEILILDSPPLGHKPINRTVSLESRDNPFIPGGSLDQEAADILKRATIIRDQFILSDSNIEQQIETDNANYSSETNNVCQDSKTDVVEEHISPQSINGNQALPVNKQNGKLEEKHSSPDSQGMDIKKEGTLERALKDKKKQKKCCSLM